MNGLVILKDLVLMTFYFLYRLVSYCSFNNMLYTLSIWPCSFWYMSLVLQYDLGTFFQRILKNKMKMGFKLRFNMTYWRHEQVVVYKVRPGRYGYQVVQVTWVTPCDQKTRSKCIFIVPFWHFRLGKGG